MYNDMFKLIGVCLKKILGTKIKTQIGSSYKRTL